MQHVSVHAKKSSRHEQRPPWPVQIAAHSMQNLSVHAKQKQQACTCQSMRRKAASMSSVHHGLSTQRTETVGTRHAALSVHARRSSRRERRPPWLVHTADRTGLAHSMQHSTVHAIGLWLKQGHSAAQGMREYYRYLHRSRLQASAGASRCTCLAKLNYL
jgi:hypothetical protein